MDNDKQVGSYSWHQSHDQATVLLLVPNDTVPEDVVVIFEHPYLVAGLRGQIPIMKGELYGRVSTEKSMWQLERMQNHRGRTTSTASTLSTQSSYAYLSDPEISSSFAASLESGHVSDNDDSDFASPERSHPVSRDEQVQTTTVPAFPQHAFSSHPASPRIPTSMTSSFSSIDSMQTGRSARLLTLHLEKSQSSMWPSLIIGPVPDNLSSCPSGPFTINRETEGKYNLDPTSLGLMGEDYLSIRHDKEEAFECLVRSWHLLHSPLATSRLVTHYLPLSLSVPELATPTTSRSPPPMPQRGTVEYYVHCVGGNTGLAQLYLDAGLSHLEGTASRLQSTSYSPLSSIRSPDPSISRSESSMQTWKRDQECARKYFERVRQLAPSMEVPYVPPEIDIRGHDRRIRPSNSQREGPDLQMPSIDMEEGGTIRPDHTQAVEALPESAVRIRKRRQEASKALVEHADQDEDNTWFLALPGLIGAGTALLVVSVIGALSFQTWRKNQT